MYLVGSYRVHLVYISVVANGTAQNLAVYYFRDIKQNHPKEDKEMGKKRKVVVEILGNAILAVAVKVWQVVVTAGTKGEK